MNQHLSRRRLIATATAMPMFVSPARAGGGYMPTPSLPDNLVVPAAEWLLSHFGEVFKAKAVGTPCSVSMLCAIACQESAYAWFRKAFLARHSVSEVLRLMVLDNSSPRSAYPRDSATFLQDRNFKDISAGLVAASDASRVERGITKAGTILFGYGLFQYDLQNILTDPAFWRDRDPVTGAVGLWGDISASVDRAIGEFGRKYRVAGGDIRETVRAYNGTGAAAEAYATIVIRFEGLIRPKTV